jgi:hypothetical protein
MGDPRVESTAAAVAYLLEVQEHTDGAAPLDPDLQRGECFTDEGAALFVGLVNVARWLLVKLEHATGQSPHEVLADIARKNEQES